jgi:hypothetical protein
MTHNNTSYTLSLGKYLCTVSKVNGHLRYSKRYFVTGTRFLGKVGEAADKITKTCTELDELVRYLRKVKDI